MQITIILPPDALSGRIRIFAVYAKRLSDRGHTVTVVQPRDPRAGLKQRLASFFRTARWTPSSEPPFSFFDNLPVYRLKLNHPGPITEKDLPNADVILATWWETAQWVWALPSSKGVKAHFMQDYEIWDGNVERVDAVCRLPMPRIVTARWVANLLASRFSSEPLAIVPNSVDTDLFSAPPRARQPAPTVGFHYTPMHNKGVDILIDAIALARRELPALKVLSFGATPVANNLPLPPDTRFSYRPADAQLPSLYASCDAWLYSARIEGFGLPLLEAMACRTPVIGTPAGAAPELLAHGGGLLVDMENPRSMADAILHVARMTPQNWKKMSDAALATARSFTWDDATDRLETALEQVRTGTPARVLQRTPGDDRKAGVG